jgi:hypothetical protein
MLWVKANAKARATATIDELRAEELGDAGAPAAGAARLDAELRAPRGA